MCSACFSCLSFFHLLYFLSSFLRLFHWSCRVPDSVPASLSYLFRVLSRIRHPFPVVPLCASMCLSACAFVPACGSLYPYVCLCVCRFAYVSPLRVCLRACLHVCAFFSLRVSCVPVGMPLLYVHGSCMPVGMPTLFVSACLSACVSVHECMSVGVSVWSSVSMVWRLSVYVSVTLCSCSYVCSVSVVCVCGACTFLSVVCMCVPVCVCAPSAFLCTELAVRCQYVRAPPLCVVCLSAFPVVASALSVM